MSKKPLYSCQALTTSETLPTDSLDDDATQGSTISEPELPLDQRCQEPKEENLSILKAYNGKDKTLARSFSLLSRNTKSEFSLFEQSSTTSSLSSTGTNLSRNIDQFGFVFDRFSISGSSCSGTSGSRDTLSVNHLRVQGQLKQLTKWEELLHRLGSLSSNEWLKRTKLKKRLFAGVPDTLRKRAWITLLKASPMSDSKDLKEIPIYLLDDYFKGISGFERQIDVDIVRTLRDHVLYKERYSAGQQKLFKLLVAFANLFPQIGYCQGMSTMAGVLLIYFEEEQAFNMMVRLFERRSLGQLYSHGFPLLFELFHIQHMLMQKFIPKIWTHFSKHGVSSNLFATKWYLSMFLCFPFSVAMRLWDLFFFYGPDIFPVFVVAVLGCLEREVMQLDFDPLLSFLCRPDEIPSLDERRIFQVLHDYWDRVTKSKTKNLPLLHREYHRKQALVSADEEVK